MCACFVRLERELKRGHEKVSANESAVDRLNKQLAKVVELAQVSLQHTTRLVFVL